MKSLTLALVVSFTGCHGTTAYIGGGKLWQNQSASYGSGCGGAGSRSDIDDSYFAGAGLAVQLTPDSVVHLDPSPSPVSTERLYPYEPAPVPDDPVITELRSNIAAVRVDYASTTNELKGTTDTLQQISGRLTKIESDLKDKLSLEDIIKLGGSGGLGLGGIAGGAWWYRRRRRPVDPGGPEGG